MLMAGCKQSTEGWSRMSRRALWRRAGPLVLVTSAVLTFVTAAGGVVPPSPYQARAQGVAGFGGVITEPSKLGSTTGMKPVYDFVLAAKKSVDMTMYELVDPTMVSDLAADQRRHRSKERRVGKEGRSRW